MFKIVKMVVACYNEDGRPELYALDLEVKEKDVFSGEAHILAKENAQYNGYCEPMVAFSENDPAFKQLAPIAKWASASKTECSSQ